MSAASRSSCVVTRSWRSASLRMDALLPGRKSSQDRTSRTASRLCAGRWVATSGLLRRRRDTFELCHRLRAQFADVLASGPVALFSWRRAGNPLFHLGHVFSVRRFFDPLDMPKLFRVSRSRFYLGMMQIDRSRAVSACEHGYPPRPDGSVDVERKRPGKPDLLLDASMARASTSVVTDQKRPVLTQPSGCPPSSSRCGHLLRYRS